MTRRFAGAGLLRRLGARGDAGSGATALPPLVAGDAGTDSGTWSNAVQTLAGGVASGGSGSYTYAWTVQSGGSGTFSDATSRTSTFTATAFGAAVVLRMTTTDTVTLLTAYDEVTLAVTRTILYGARYHWHFEPSAGTVTLNGANVSQLNDRGPSGYHMTQGTAANQPLYVASGGPNNAPYVVPNDTNDYIMNTAISLSSDRALSFITVEKADTAGTRLGAQRRDSGTNPAGGNAMRMYNSSTNFRGTTKPHGGAEVDGAFTVPAVHTNWAANRLTHAASVAPVVTIGGTTATPALGGTGRCAAIELIAWGHDSLSGRSCAFDLCVESIGSNELALEIAYALSAFGLTLA